MQLILIVAFVLNLLFVAQFCNLELLIKLRIMQDSAEQFIQGKQTVVVDGLTSC